jgi:hypothetical protein
MGKGKDVSGGWVGIDRQGNDDQRRARAGSAENMSQKLVRVLVSIRMNECMGMADSESESDEAGRSMPIASSDSEHTDLIFYSWNTAGEERVMGG